MKKLLLTIAVAVATNYASGQVTLIHEFGNTNDGVHAQSSVIYDGTFLYGTTVDGGINNDGIIYKVKPDGTGYQKLYDFDGVAGGSQPYGSLLCIGSTLYGMTATGSVGYGVLYKIQTDGSGFTNLLDFGIAASGYGQSPLGSLYYDGTFLYGMTQSGGGIFKIMPDGSGFALIHTFDGTHGSSPYGTLISDGTYLYGTTHTGGSAVSNNLGTIFKIMPDGSNFSVINEFNGPNGDGPMGTLLLEGGYLYGTTSGGGLNSKGTIFKIMTDGTGFTKIFDFNTTGTGGNPGYGTLVSDGTYLYGTTGNSGTFNLGTVFKIKHDGTDFTDMFDFNVTLGAFALTELLLDGTTLYGTTNSGGVNSGGVVFKVGLATGISEMSDRNEIDISPNPSNGKFSISFNKKYSEACELKIYNSLGEIIYSKKNVNSQTVSEINLSSEKPGIYLLQLINENKNIITKKIIINN